MFNLIISQSRLLRSKLYRGNRFYFPSTLSLLHPLYFRFQSVLHSRLSAKSSWVASTPLSQKNQHSLNLPLIDRLVITDQAIVATTCRSLKTSSEVQLVSRDVKQFTDLVMKSQADVIVLTGPTMTLQSSEVMLGVQQLHRNPLDLVRPGTPSPTEATESEPTQSYPALYHFLSDSFEVRQVSPEGSGAVTSGPSNSPQSNSPQSESGDCYIVRREALISMLHLWEWTDNQFVRRSRATEEESDRKLVTN
jgi:hypothetical protein